MRLTKSAISKMPKYYYNKSILVTFEGDPTTTTIEKTKDIYIYIYIERNQRRIKEQFQLLNSLKLETENQMANK